MDSNDNHAHATISNLTSNDQSVARRALRIGFETSATSAQGVGACAMAKYVQEATGGRLTIDIFPDSQLGNGARMLEMVRNGDLDLFLGGPGIFSSMDKRLNVFDIPYLFHSSSTARRTLAGPAGRQILDAFDAMGLKALSFWETGMRDITNNLQPIVKVEDLQGMRMRIPVNNPAQSELWALLGTRPVPLPFGAILDRLKAGEVDAQEHPIGTIYSGALHTAQKFLTLTGHMYTPMIQVMRLAAFDALSNEDRDLLLTASRLGSRVQQDFSDANDRKDLDAIKATGVAINVMNEVERLRLRAMTRPPMERAYTEATGGAWLSSFADA